MPKTKRNSRIASSTKKNVEMLFFQILRLLEEKEKLKRTQPQATWQPRKRQD